MSSPLTKLSANELRDFMKDNLPPGLVEKKPEPKRKKICLGILSYDGKIETRTVSSIMMAVMQAAERGWGFTMIWRDGDSMVARGRSFLASQFLQVEQCKDCTDFVQIDADLAWSGDEFVRICEHPVDIVGGAYPFKDESGDFPLRWPATGLMEENGLWEVQAVTPGFLRVSRYCLERIAADMPWLEFRDRGNAEGIRSWMFFDNLQRPSGVYDEGYVFCERAKQAGFKTYLDPDLNISHIGKKAFNHGTIRQWLERKSAHFEKLEAEFPNVPPLKLMSKVMGANIDLAQEQAKAEAAE